MPGGKQRTEVVGKSIADARAADGKRKIQKKEGRIFDMLPESKITVNELSDWYLELAAVKRLASHKRIGYALNTVCAEIGERTCNSLKPVDIENYQAARSG
ncbi:MAG: site-specific integrase, partial [Desulfobacterales bacterium]